MISYDLSIYLRHIIKRRCTMVKDLVNRGCNLKIAERDMYRIGHRDRTCSVVLCCMYFIFCDELRERKYDDDDDDVVCWTSTPDVYGLRSTAHSASDLPSCQSACVNDTTCVAVDWEPHRKPGFRCWLTASREIAPFRDPGAITHYELRRNCAS